MHTHPEMLHGYAQANGVRLHYVEQGRVPLVILACALRAFHAVRTSSSASRLTWSSRF